MSKKFLVLSVLAIATLPSCMHPVDQVLQARTQAKQDLLVAQGRVADGACDDVGRLSARNAAGLTISSTEIVQASAQDLR